MEKLEKNKFLKAAETVVSPLIRSYLGERGNNIKILFTIGNLSYSNPVIKTIQVALKENEMENFPKQDLMKILKFKGFHEASHQLYTDEQSFGLCINSVFDIYQNALEAEGLTGYDKYLIKQSHYLVNSLEDGRIENIMVNNRPGLKKHRDWYRINDWEHYDLEVYSKKLSVYTIIKNEILTIATTGIHSLNFSKVYEDESDISKVVDKCIRYISDFVVSNTLKETVEYCKNIAEIVAPYIVEEIKNYDENNNDFGNSRFAGGEENFASDECIANNGPVIAIITDDTEFTEEKQEDAKKPDIIIDLRTKKEKKSSEDETSSEGEEAESSGKSSPEDETSSEGEGAESSGKPSPEDETSSEGEGAESSGKPSPKDETSSENDKFIKKLKELKEDIENKLFKDSLAEIKKVNDIYSQLEKAEMQGNVTPITVEDMRDINNILEDNVRFEEIDLRYEYPSVSAPEDIISIGQANRYKIKQALEIKKTDDMHDCLHGDIDCSQLDKFITGQPDFFFNEGSEKIPEGCIFILKDNSGSMNNSKESLAIETLSIIEESIKGLLPTKITAFSNSGCEMQKMIKDWDDNDISRSYTWGYHMAGNKPNGGNEDEQSILIAAKQLLKRHEVNKLLIIISDGCPLSPEKVNKAVRWVRNKGIFVCSFFIGTQKFLKENMENYRFMYENYFVGVTPDNLSENLYNFIKEFVDNMN